MNLPKIHLNQKPNYLKLAEDIDFLELFKKIENKFDICFILESLGEQSHTSRYSVIGFDPQQIISAKGNTLFIHTKNKIQSFEVENPYFVLRNIVPQNSISRGYAGGLVGYLNYDCINYFEPTLKVKVSPHFEQFKFGVFEDGLVYDKVTGEVFYFYYETNRIDQIKLLQQTLLPKREKISVTFLGDTMNKEQHAKVVEKIKDDIRAGLIFQCEVGFKSEFEIKGDTTCIYEKLRNVNPSPFMYYLKFGEQKIIGASPELLFQLKNGEMETHPLAGTIRRGKDEIEDKKLARQLLNDPKEIAEHNMLVDLHRNDIGRVSEFGTVKVRSLMDIKKFSHVQHISSEITGIIRQGEDMFSTLACNFPAGTLSGAPKLEAMKIIDRNEPDARGPYGGGLGHFGFNGNCTFAIPIRTLFMSGEYGYVQTCGGNVYDSVAENEYDEIQRKLAPMKKVLSSF